MLPNYDAKAIAEVLGLAFLRDPKGVATAHTPSVPRGGQSSSRPRSGHDVAIRVDGATLRIVEAKGGPAASGAPGGRRSEAEGDPSAPSSTLIERAVEQGLPRTALRHLAEQLAGDDGSKIAALEWGVVPKTTLERRDARLSPGESERTERIARLFVHARRALGTEVEAREFMTTAHPELDGRRPLDAAMTDLGTRRAEQILTVLEYGLAL